MTHRLNVTPAFGIALVVFLVELYLQTFGNRILEPVASGSLHLLSGLLLGGLLLHRSTKYTLPKGSPAQWSSYQSIVLLFAVVVFGTFAGLFDYLIDRFPDATNHKGYSDIIPQLKHLVERQLDGLMPYAPTTEWHFQLFPTYLPLQWWPFIVPELLHLDYRWMMYAVFAGTAVFTVFATMRSNSNWQAGILVTVLLGAAWLMMLQAVKIESAHTMESLIAGYYLLLALALMHGRWRMAVIVLGVCLLSRYAVVLFVPLILLVLWDQQRTQWFKYIAILIAMALICYILPYWTIDPFVFLKSYDYHSRAALGEWMHLDADGRPIHLFKGIGLTSLSYLFLPGDLAERLQQHQMIHLSFCLLVVAGLSVLYWMKRHQLAVGLFLLAGLKIYFCFFYGFIQIPYRYLFMTPIMTSALVVLAIGMAQKKRYP